MGSAIHDIARQFLPLRPHYYYARIKLATDPLYAGVGEVLAGTSAPLLDLGCGIGLLAHALRAQGFSGPYLGVDSDARKIDSARAAGGRAELAAVAFTCFDLENGFPDHEGSVALLDILQFLAPTAQDAVLERAMDCLVPGSRLVIRSGLALPGWRLAFTRGVDRLARLVGWMNVGPQRYPDRSALERRFAERGLTATFRPLHGRMPFENWLICAALGPGQTRSARPSPALTPD